MKLVLQDLQILCQQRTRDIFKHYLEKLATPAPLLQQAMSYAIVNGGKRLRPLLIYTTGYALGAPWENLDVPATAIEMIHSYSLIHDDLPAMDNSDLRRGKPTCHKVYGDAIAILAGDALQTLAFEILTSHPAPQLWPYQRLAMIQALCHASGLQGIAAGQTLDIQKVNNLSEITAMYQLKTGILLSACINLSLIAANVSDPQIISSLENFAHCIGLAFQIQDDLLDIEGEVALTGKPNGIDAANQKVTYVSLVGIDHARQKINELFESAITSIQILGEKSVVLLELANFILQREK